MIEKPSFLLSPSIFKKSVHMLGLVFLFPMLLLNRLEQIALFGLIVILTWILFRFMGYGLIGVCLLLLMFDQKIVAGAWITLIIGDGLAGIVGLLWGRKVLPWNKCKTTAGMAAFVLSVVMSLTIFYTIAIRINVVQAFVVATISALVSSIVESLPLRVNDNLTVVLSSGIVSRLCLLIILTIG